MAWEERTVEQMREEFVRRVLAQPLQTLTVQMQGLAGQAETVMTDLGGMVRQVEALTADSQAAVTAATRKLDSIDVATLNKAIQDLAQIVEPLAKAVNIFS